MFGGMPIGGGGPGSPQSGVMCAGRLRIATEPANAETVTIGGHEFRFLTTLIAANTYTQVKRGTGVATVRTDFIDAINGTSNANVVPASTPHTVPVVADLIDTSRIRVRRAAVKGGPAAAMTPTSIAVSKTLGAAADVWDVANLNELGAAPGKAWSTGKVVVTAAMIIATQVFLEFPFTPTTFIPLILSSGGGIRYCNEAVAIDGNAIRITLLGGASPNTQAGDTLHVIASE
jgi:hypothetical protein